MVDTANLNNKQVKNYIEIADENKKIEEIISIQKEPSYKSVHSVIYNSIKQDRSFSKIAVEHLRPLTIQERERLDMDNEMFLTSKSNKEEIIKTKSNKSNATTVNDIEENKADGSVIVIDKGSKNNLNKNVNINIKSQDNQSINNNLKDVSESKDYTNILNSEKENMVNNVSSKVDESVLLKNQIKFDNKVELFEIISQGTEHDEKVIDNE